MKLAGPSFALIAMATSSVACPWSGGDFSGNKGNFRTTFSVNSGCSSMTFQSSGNAGFQPVDTPENFALKPSAQGWEADINGVTATLLKDGRWVNFIGAGVNNRVQVKKQRARGGQR